MSTGLLTSVGSVGASVFTALAAGLTIVKDAASLTFMLLGARFLLGFAFVGLLFSAVWVPNHPAILEASEAGWRCTVYPVVNLFTRLLDAVQLVYNNTVCWWNAFVITRNLFGKRILLEELGQCANGADIQDLVEGGISVLGTALRSYARWLLSGIFVQPMPVQGVVFQAQQVLLGDVRAAFTCLCADLRVLWDIVLRAAAQSNVACAIHQGANGAWALAQIGANYSYDALFTILGSLNGSLTLTEVYDSLLGTGSLSIPSLAPAVERLAAAAHYGSYALNDVTGSLICTLYVEVEIGGTLPDRELAFQQCLTYPATPERAEVCMTLYPGNSNLLPRAICNNEATRNLNIFGWAGSSGAALIRFTHSVAQVGLNAVRIVDDFLTLPMGGRYLVDEWTAEAVFDTLRRPLAPYATPVPGASAIEAPNPTLYGQVPAVGDLDPCSGAGDANITLLQNFTVIPCASCNRLVERSVEEELLILTEQVDDLLEPSVGARVITPLIRCAFIAPLRVVVALVKFPTDLLRRGASGVDELLEWLQERRHIDALWAEIAGAPTELGGILGCLQALVQAVEPRLVCLYRLGALPVKAALELVRELLLSYTYLAASATQLASLTTYGPTLSEALCLDGPTCIDLDETVYSWIRRPRDRSELVYLTSDSGAGTQDYLPNLEYINVLPPVSAAPGDAVWVECVCEVLDIAFVNQFLDPGDQINPALVPDICCGLRFGVRLLTEALRSLTELGLGAIQTFLAIINGNSSPDVLLRWAACSDAEVCSPLLELKSDLQDFLDCPCSFLGSVEINGEPIPCLCDGIDAAVRAVVVVLQAVYGFAAAGGQVAICFTKVPFFDGDECQVHLYTRVLDSLERLLFANVLLGDAVGSVGCLLGTLFSYQDCNDAENPFTCITSAPNPDQCAEPVFFLETAGTVLPEVDWERNLLLAPINPAGCDCSPSSRFRILFTRGYELISLVIVIPLDLVIQIVTIVKEQSGGLFILTSIQTAILIPISWIEDAVQIVFEKPYTGIPYPQVDSCGRLKNLAYLRPGIVSILGLIFRCLFGTAGPGDTLIQISVLVSSVSGFIFKQLRAAVGLVTLFIQVFSGGNTGVEAAADFAEQLATFIWDIFRCLVASAGDLLTASFEILRGFAFAISPDAFDGVVELLFNVIRPVVGVVIDFIETLTKKRTAAAGGKKRGWLASFVDLASESVEYSADKVTGEYTKQRARQKRLHSSDYWAATGRDGWASRVRTPDEHELRMMTDVRYRAEHMLEGSGCARLTRLVADADGQDPAALSPAEQLLYEACTLAGYAEAATNLVLFDEDDHAQGVHLPLGSFYDLSTFAATAGLTMDALDLFVTLDEGVAMNHSFVDLRHLAYTDGAAGKRSSAEFADQGAGEEAEAGAEDQFTTYELCQFGNYSTLYADAAHCTPEDEVNPVYHGLARLMQDSHARRQHNFFSSLYSLGHPVDRRHSDTQTEETSGGDAFDSVLQRLRGMRAEVQHPERKAAFVERMMGKMHEAGYRGPEARTEGRIYERVRWSLGLRPHLENHYMTILGMGDSTEPEPAAVDDAADTPTNALARTPEKQGAQGQTGESDSDGIRHLRITHPLLDHLSLAFFALGKHWGRMSQQWSEHIPNHLANRVWNWYTVNGTRTEAPDGIAGLLNAYPRVQEVLARAVTLPALPAPLTRALLAPRTVGSGETLLAQVIAPPENEQALEQEQEQETEQGQEEDTRIQQKRAMAANVTCGVTQPCTGCVIVTSFIEQAVDNFEFCRDLAAGDTSVIPPVPSFQNPIPIELVPVSNTTSSTGVAPLDWVTATVDGWIGGDSVATALAFVRNTNTDPYVDYVGAIAFLPFVNRCDRDVHLSGAFGLGLAAGLYYALWVVVVLTVALYWLSPALSNIITGPLMAAGLLITFIFLTLGVAYNYNVSCVISPGALITGGSVMFFGVPVPLLDDMVALRDKYVQPTWTWIPQVGDEIGTSLEPGCPAGRRDFGACTDLPISGVREWTAETLYWLLPRTVVTTTGQLVGPLLTPFGLDRVFIDPLDEVALNYTQPQLELLQECRERVGIPGSLGLALVTFFLVFVVVFFLYSTLSQVTALSGVFTAIWRVLASDALFGGSEGADSGGGDLAGVTPLVAASGASEFMLEDYAASTGTEPDAASVPLDDGEELMEDAALLDDEGGALADGEGESEEGEGEAEDPVPVISSLFASQAGRWNPTVGVEAVSLADAQRPWGVTRVLGRAAGAAQRRVYEMSQRTIDSYTRKAKRH